MATGSATEPISWFHVIPHFYKVEHRSMIVHFQSCSRETGNFDCLCSFLSMSGWQIVKLIIVYKWVVSPVCDTGAREIMKGKSETGNISKVPTTFGSLFCSMVKAS